MENDIKKLKAQVGYVLKKFRATRNDDEKLIVKVSELFGVNPIKKASSIERLRRRYNEDGEYLPTSKKVLLRRHGYTMEWKKELGYH